MFTNLPSNTAASWNLCHEHDVQLTTSPLVTPQQELDVFSLPKTVPFNKVPCCGSAARHPAAIAHTEMQQRMIVETIVAVKGKRADFTLC
jgi:hypothetical protein